MNIVSDLKNYAGRNESACIAIGVFDGVHLGHQQVIRQATTDASHFETESVVVTFDKHPNAVVAPHAVPNAVYSLDQKLETIRSLGVDTTIVINFDRAFSQMRAEDFVEQLVNAVGRVRSICVGRKFTFGHKRGGNVELLKSMGDQLGFKVHGLAAVSLDGQVVSSTRIREVIAAGDLDHANQMLGRDYKLRGRVTRGDGIGRRLGFPTANIDVTGVQTPPNGVYAVHVFHNQTVLRGVANIGVRPTVSGDLQPPRLEVHLLNFDQDIYDAKLDVQFLQFIRPEQKFSSLDALKRQIASDITTAERLF